MRLFETTAGDETSSTGRIVTGNHEVSCSQHSRPIGLPLNPGESGFYASSQRQATARGARDGLMLLTRVNAIHQATGHSYGSRRMAKQLQDEGFSVGRYKARRLMKQAGIAVGRPKRRPVTTDSRHGYAVAPNLLARQFDVEQPDKVWAGDITYLWTAEGWLYLATVLDMYSRKVVGWAMSSRIDAELVQEALRMALG